MFDFSYDSQSILVILIVCCTHYFMTGAILYGAHTKTSKLAKFSLVDISNAVTDVGCAISFMSHMKPGACILVYQMFTIIVVI